uniref:Platelet-derived growth factor (PDGF) family profile domain-containing protein n=1 Tax=Cacopsylla melanoneura TaxID=428564 RepID=A0A8D8YCC6_9HEMI
MRNNSFLYICLLEILIVYIMYVDSNNQHNKKYKPNTKYISTHNIRHKHHYVNRTLAVTKKPNYNHKHVSKPYSHSTTTIRPFRLKTGGKVNKPIDTTTRKPVDGTTKTPAVHRQNPVKPIDATFDLLDFNLKNKLLNNNDKMKLNDLSNSNNLAPPLFDLPINNDHQRSPPSFDQFLQKDSPHFHQADMKTDELMSKADHLISEKDDHLIHDNDDHGDEDNDDDDDDNTDEEEEEEDDIAIFDDELSSSTLTITSSTSTTIPTMARRVKELNDSAETSKLNMVRSRSVPYRSDIAGVKTARSPPSPPSPPSFDSPSTGTTEDSDTLQERLASKHKTKVGKDAACRKPMPKVVKVSDVYPTATKIYLPQCTIIHQCAEDTGCCMGAFQKCGPKSSEKVDLYFYTYTTSAIRKGVSPHQIEKLGFYNHTECECHEDMPRDDSNVIENDTKGGSDTHSVEEEPPCMCPTEFAVRRFSNGTCGCDCFDKERDCLRYKKGKEYFSLKDKWCIKIGKCQPPICEYGKFSQKTGRCPRLNEKSPFF